MQAKSLVTAFAGAALFGAGLFLGVHLENNNQNNDTAAQAASQEIDVQAESGDFIPEDSHKADIALFQTIDRKDAEEVANLVNNRGANPNAWLNHFDGYRSGFDGRMTAVSWAIMRDDVKSAEFLLKHGATPDNIYLSEALLDGNTAMARMLIENGIEYDRMGPEELQTIINNCYRDQSRPFAESDKDFGFIDFVVEKYGIPVTDEIIAAEGGHISSALFTHLQELQRTQKAAPKAPAPGM